MAACYLIKYIRHCDCTEYPHVVEADSKEEAIKRMTHLADINGDNIYIVSISDAYLLYKYKQRVRIEDDKS